MGRSLLIDLLTMLILLPLLRSLCGSVISRTSIVDDSSQLYKSLLPPKPQQDVALVAALDGTVCLVDATSGNIRWSFSSGSPIYSSYQATPTSNSDDDRHSNASELSNDFYYVDCGDDWELYVHSTRFGKLQKLALTAEDYVKMTPLISEDGEITLGFKRTTAFLVDAKTGRVVRTYGFDNSTSILGPQGAEKNALVLVPDAALMKSVAADLGTVQHLVYVTRTDYVLQHYSPNSTEVLWNVAFADIEAEFRCQGFKSSLGGVSPGDDEDTDDTEFPCQMRTPVLRLRDRSLLDFNKLAIAHLGGAAHFLPASDQIFPRGPSPVQRFPFALPSHEGRPKLALPSSDTGNPWNLDLPSANVSKTGGTTISTDGIIKSHMWSILAAISSILGSVFFNFLSYRKHIKLNKPVEELKVQPGLQKRKKSKRSGNNKSSPSSERKEVEVDERKLLTLSDVVDARVESVDGRKIGKLVVSNTEIAKGSNGTVVLEGNYDGRCVAVKRLVQTHHDVALKEIQNLIASDQHPNIIRWFGVEYDQDFIYLALERCSCSLNEFIYGYSQSFQGGAHSEDAYSSCAMQCTVQLQSELENSGHVELWKANGHPSTHLLKLMSDVVHGLVHLHEIGIIHRDLKPQNVLIMIKKKSFSAKLSDMGISKHLVGDMSSLTRNTTGYGSSGWQAPEQLLKGRQTRAVDLFSLGCVLFFCLTGGKHPFGDSIERDVNIVNDRKDLFLIENIPEAVDLFSRLLDPNPDMRPKAQEVLDHPLFWTSEKRLVFIQDISDRVELEDRESESKILNALESTATVALNGKWDEKMEPAFINNIGRYRRYKYDSVRDLLRVIRNKSHHYRELPQEIKELLGSHPEGFENYFSYRFPKLLIEVYKVMCRYCKEEEVFRKYFESNGI